MEYNREEVMREYEIQIKLHINEQLYKKGVISREVFDKAKTLIFQSKGKKGSCH